MKIYVDKYYFLHSFSKVGDRCRKLPKCREGPTPFPGLLPFTLDTYLILLSVKQVGIKYNFKSLWYDVTWD